MTNTESTPTPLTWRRDAPGEYLTAPPGTPLRAGYLVSRSTDGRWYAYAPSRPGEVGRDHLGAADTMREAKALCQRHADTPAETDVPPEWVDQLVTMLDAGATVTLHPYGAMTVTGAGSWTLSLDRVRQAVYAAIERGICVAVEQMDGTETIELTERFRAERATKRGITVGAVVSYRSPMALRANSGRWRVISIESEYVRVGSLDHKGTRSAWPIERAELADRHAYAASHSGRVCGALIRDLDGYGADCPHPADHPIHT